MSLRNGFAAALRDARKRKELTQEDFSNVSSRTYLSSLERGIKSPTIDKVDKIASVIGIHPVTLLVLAYSRSEDTDIQQLFSRVISETKSLI
jgi:transcriptional regulator with XRE-family HTH domain